MEEQQLERLLFVEHLLEGFWLDPGFELVLVLIRDCLVFKVRMFVINPDYTFILGLHSISWLFIGSLRTRSNFLRIMGYFKIRWNTISKINWIISILSFSVSFKKFQPYGETSLKIYTANLARAKLPANAGNFTFGSHVKRHQTQFSCVTCSLPVKRGKLTCVYAASTSRRKHANCLQLHLNLIVHSG